MTPLFRPQRRQGPETIVPLVDVVFFLLVFALLIGRMDATAPFQVMPPEARLGADLPTGGTTAALSHEGSALNGEVLSEEELHRRLTLLVAADPGHRIRIQADQRLRLAQVLPLVDHLEAEGAEEVVLVVTPGG